MSCELLLPLLCLLGLLHLPFSACSFSFDHFLLFVFFFFPLPLCCSVCLFVCLCLLPASFFLCLCCLCHCVIVLSGWSCYVSARSSHVSGTLHSALMTAKKHRIRRRRRGKSNKNKQNQLSSVDREIEKPIKVLSYCHFKHNVF